MRGFSPPEAQADTPPRPGRERPGLFAKTGVVMETRKWRSRKARVKPRQEGKSKPAAWRTRRQAFVGSLPARTPGGGAHSRVERVVPDAPEFHPGSAHPTPEPRASLAHLVPETHKPARPRVTDAPRMPGRLRTQQPLELKQTHDGKAVGDCPRADALAPRRSAGPRPRSLVCVPIGWSARNGSFDQHDPAMVVLDRRGGMARSQEPRAPARVARLLPQLAHARSNRVLPGSTTPPGTSSEKSSMPWRNCRTSTSFRSGVTANTFTQSGASITTNSRSVPRAGCV